MSSNIKIERICEWCGNKFIAQTTVTRFCCKRCAEHSYKERLRQKKMAVSNQETAQTNIKWRDKDYLTPTQAAELLGIGRMSIDRCLVNSKRFSGFIARQRLIKKVHNGAEFVSEVMDSMTCAKRRGLYQLSLLEFNGEVIRNSLWLSAHCTRHPLWHN